MYQKVSGNLRRFQKTEWTQYIKLLINKVLLICLTCNQPAFPFLPFLLTQPQFKSYYQFICASDEVSCSLWMLAILIKFVSWKRQLPDFFWFLTWTRGITRRPGCSWSKFSYSFARPIYFTGLLRGMHEWQ